MGEKLLEVKNLTIGFPGETGIRKVVDDVSFCVGYGEIVGIVGESGSGKSMTVQTIMGLKNRDAHIMSGEKNCQRFRAMTCPWFFRSR